MTNKYELIPFDVEHIGLMDLREGQCIDKNSYICSDLGLAYTLVADDVIICCAGVVNQRPKVGECWLIASAHFNEYKYLICKTIKNFLKMVDTFYHRLQMSVKVDFKEAQQFAEYLGFECEGLMRKFDINGADYFLYGRVK
jgi:hypothetical protein